MRYYILLFITLIFFSCQDEITLALPQAENKLVVEGSIEPGFPPYVILTNNQGYFESIDENTYNNLFIDDVDSVMVWFFDDAGEKIKINLEKISGLDSLPPIYTDLEYFNNPSNYSFSQEEKTYFLEIHWNNKIISSFTTIPRATPLDCLWVEQSDVTTDNEFKCEIRAMYSDPVNEQNNILIRSKRTVHYEQEDSLICSNKNTPDFNLKLVDSGSDVLINGESFETYFPRPKDNGFPTGKYNSFRTKNCDDGTDLVFPEDIVLIKFCQIDEPSLKFWRGLVRQAGNNGNPFAEPLNLVSNIDGGLGVWTGYSPVYYKVPIVIDTTIFDQYFPEIIDIF